MAKIEPMKYKVELWEMSDGRLWEVREYEDGIVEAFSVLLNKMPDGSVGTGTALSLIGAYRCKADVIEYAKFWLRLEVVERVKE